MNLVPSAVTRTIARSVLRTKANSPTLMFAGGIAGVIGASVLACRATLQLNDTLDAIEKQKLDEDVVVLDKKGHEIDPNKIATALYIKNAATVCKLYAPAVALGAVSIAALAGSHRTLTKRNVALTAAYAAVERGFAEYRARVLEDVGPDKEREYRYPMKNVDIVDDSGKKAKQRQVDPNGLPPYARLFDASNPNWGGRRESNLYFIRMVQNYANDRLRMQGHVFLNEVYDHLGMSRTTAGAVVGWYLGGDGDDFVDFGIFNGDDDPRLTFGPDGSILLNFNVDGLIYEKI